MIKPNSLRARLTEAFPDEFALDTTRLALWIEEGHVQCNAAPDNLNFTVSYKLSVSIEGWRLASALIWIVVIDWLRRQQPELLTAAQSGKAIPFEVDLVSNEEADIGFDLRLTEAVRVTRRDDGGFTMAVVEEPETLFPDMAPLLPCGALLKEIWAPGDDPVKLVPDG